MLSGRRNGVHKREAGREAGSESWQLQPGSARPRWQLPHRPGR